MNLAPKLKLTHPNWKPYWDNLSSIAELRPSRLKQVVTAAREGHGKAHLSRTNLHLLYPLPV